jgi:hypothetical protein
MIADEAQEHSYRQERSNRRLALVVGICFVIVLFTVNILVHQKQASTLTPAQMLYVQQMRADITNGKPLKNAIVEMRGGIYALLTDVAPDRSSMTAQIYYKKYDAVSNKFYDDPRFVVKTSDDSWIFHIKNITRTDEKKAYAMARKMLLPADDEDTALADCK